MNTDKPRLTIKDIAAACGVSIATVSYVLNDRAEERISEATRKRILHYVNLHGYETSLTARALATGQNSAAGVFAPPAQRGGDRAEATLLFLRALSHALEKRSLRAVLLTEQCLSQRSAHVDAIVAVNPTREEFYSIGEANFRPLVCVDGCMDDLMLFYQVYDDFYAVAARAREIGAKERLFLLCDAYRDEGIMRRVREAFGSVCDSGDAALAARVREEAGDAAFVAIGSANYERLRAQGAEPVCVLYEGQRAPAGAEGRVIALPLLKKAETVAQLVVDTIRRESGPEHDIRIF